MNTQLPVARTKREIQQRKQALVADLRAAYRDGQMVSGDMALSQRELSAKYGLSIRTVALELQELVKEGILYTLPRVGTFVGRPAGEKPQVYLLILGYHGGPGTFVRQVRQGFEERVAQLGGAAVTLSESEVDEHLGGGAAFRPSAIFQFSPGRYLRYWAAEGVPCITFQEQVPGVDTVRFDDVEGGRQAARHLLRMGHRRMAFLAQHSLNGLPADFRWSMDRLEGWREVVSAAGLAAPSFHPEQVPEIMVDGSQTYLARQSALRFLEAGDIPAVAAVNHYSAMGLFQMLREMQIPASRWPAVVSFDEDPEVDGSIISSVRLPWNTVGREAASLLSERLGRRVLGESRVVSVPMVVIPKLSCRADWGLVGGLAQRQSQVFAGAGCA